MSEFKAVVFASVPLMSSASLSNCFGLPMVSHESTEFFSGRERTGVQQSRVTYLLSGSMHQICESYISDARTRERWGHNSERKAITVFIFNLLLMMAYVHLTLNVN